MKLNCNASGTVKLLAFSLVLLSAGSSWAADGTPATASPISSPISATPSAMNHVMTPGGAATESGATAATTVPSDLASKAGATSETVSPANPGDPAGLKPDGMNGTSRNVSPNAAVGASGSAEAVTEGVTGSPNAAATGDSNTKKLFDYLKNGAPQTQAGTDPGAGTTPATPGANKP